MATLLVIHGLEQGRRYVLDQPVMRIGRDASNGVRVADNEISRQHAEIRREDGGYSIVDLGSSNGIYVNGRRVPQSHLQTGDRVQLGQTVFLFGAGTTVARADLAKKITMITQAAAEQASAIVRTISQEEGSQFLRRVERADPSWLKGAVAHLRVLYETSRAVSHIVDVDELLARILELAFQSVTADHGCVLLSDPDTGSIECRAVHYGSAASREEPIEVSKTIVDYVLAKGEGVRTSDAAADQRFSPGKSIVRMGITEAICVPMQGRHAMLGVIYVDRRTPVEESLDAPKPPSRLTDEQLKLLVAIGHQAALAVEDTRHYQALVQSERLAAVGQTIATLSHHIKNILQGVKAGSHLIEMGLDAGETEQVRRGWNVVNKNQTKIYNLVMDMLTYSKEREPAFESADLNEVVSEVVELMEQRAAEIGVKLEPALDSAVPKIAIDPEGIHRAVLNIVANALDATEQKEGGRVLVRTAYDAAKSVVRVHVEDNGAGIPPDELGQIFALFASTKGARGTGIGLPVSEKIIKEHGGSIQVRSQPGEGTEFIVELPARDESAAAQ